MSEGAPEPPHIGVVSCQFRLNHSHRFSYAPVFRAYKLTLLPDVLHSSYIDSSVQQTWTILQVKSAVMQSVCLTICLKLHW